VIPRGIRVASLFPWPIFGREIVPCFVNREPEQFRRLPGLENVQRHAVSYHLPTHKQSRHSGETVPLWAKLPKYVGRHFNTCQGECVGLILAFHAPLHSLMAFHIGRKSMRPTITLAVLLMPEGAAIKAWPDGQVACRSKQCSRSRRPLSIGVPVSVTASTPHTVSGSCGSATSVPSLTP
jgi:hypothetical protein